MSKRVLVIDDDEAIRKCFLLAHEDTEYQVDTCKSGKKGIEMVQATKYDLIYLDLKMPGLDGVDTLGGIRKIDKDTPIYIITAFCQEFFGKLEDAAKNGIDFQVVQKPLSSDQIVMATKSVLEGPMDF